MAENGNLERSQAWEPEKLEAGSIVEASPTLKWLDNFWYHYKWTVIVVAFFLTVGIICLVQFFTRPSYDTSITIACPYRMNNEERADFEALMESLVSDFNGDGDKLVNVMIYQIYSEDEFLAEKESIEAVETGSFDLNRQFNLEEYNNFNRLTMTGENSVYLLSPYLYETLRQANRLKPLSEIYPDGTLPAGAREDGYGINLSETDFYKYHSAAQVLPDSLILCVHRPTLKGAASNEATYANELTFFRALADYKVLE